MANPHFEIKITKRSKRQSAVAGAAYQSGERLFSEYDQEHKDYTRKDGVAYTGLYCRPMLCRNMRTGKLYEMLWRLWRNSGTHSLPGVLLLALPREVPEEMYPEKVREYYEWKSHKESTTD